MDEMVYKVPPYNDELDTNEADDSYSIQKRFRGVSYRSPRIPNDVNNSRKYYVIFREDFDELTQAIYVEADSPKDAIVEARLVEWLSFKGNDESTFSVESPFDLIAVIKGWPENATPTELQFGHRDPIIVGLRG